MTGEQEFDPEVINEFKAALMKLDGVQAVGESIADGKPCLKVYFLDDASMQTTLIPDAITIPVVKVVSGAIRPQ